MTHSCDSEKLVSALLRAYLNIQPAQAAIQGCCLLVSVVLLHAGSCTCW